MPTYILLTTLTVQGVQTLKSNPDRLREVNRDVEELGAKVLHQWATLGPFDFVNVVEAPDADGARHRGIPGRSHVVHPRLTVLCLLAGGRHGRKHHRETERACGPR